MLRSPTNTLPTGGTSEYFGRDLIENCPKSRLKGMMINVWNKSLEWWRSNEAAKSGTIQETAVEDVVDDINSQTLVLEEELIVEETVEEEAVV